VLGLAVTLCRDVRRNVRCIHAGHAANVRRHRGSQWRHFVLLSCPIVPAHRSSAVARSQVAAFDVLGDVLAGLGLRTRLFCRMEVAAPWSMVFGRTDLAHFHAVESGRCWLETTKAPPLALAAGDLLVLSRGGPYQLADEPGRKGTPLEEVVPGASDGRYTFVRHGGDGPTHGVG